MMPTYISILPDPLTCRVYFFAFQETLPSTTSSINYHQTCSINLTFPSTSYPIHYIQDVCSHGSYPTATASPPCPLKAGSEQSTPAYLPARYVLPSCLPTVYFTLLLISDITNTTQRREATQGSQPIPYFPQCSPSCLDHCWRRPLH